MVQGQHHTEGLPKEVAALQLTHLCWFHTERRAKTSKSMVLKLDCFGPSLLVSGAISRCMILTMSM